MIPLFSILHGSRLYGTSTENSDIDFKTVYLPDLGELLVGQKLEIFKERESGPRQRTVANEVEEEFIPIQLFAKHFLENQSYALEIAHAYRQGLITSFDGGHKDRVEDFINELLTRYSNKTIDSIIGYSYSQAMKYSQKGERYSAICSLIGIVQVYLEGNQWREIGDIAEKWYTTNEDEPIFIGTIPATRSNEEQKALVIGNKTFAFNTLLKHFLKGLNILRDKYGERSKESHTGGDWKAISHAIRIANQGIELLETGRITFPSPIKDYLLLIRNGEIDKLITDSVMNEYLKTLKEVQKTSDLQPRTQELTNSFNTWLQNKMLSFYGIGE